MLLDPLLLKLLISWAALWHVLAYAAGAVFVYFSYRALFGVQAYESRWGKIIRGADLHLWLSGLALIGLGMALKGADAYFANPKLWSKIGVVFVWFVSTQYMRLFAIPALRVGARQPMLVACAFSLACWLYGAFLGCAKTLAYGEVSLRFFTGGFLLTLILCLALTALFERRYMRKGLIRSGD